MLFGTAPAVRVQEANVINGELADRQKSGGIGRPPARLSYNTLIHPRWEIAPLPKHETQEHDISVDHDLEAEAPACRG